VSTWRQRWQMSRLAVVKAGKSAGQTAHKVAAQGLARARLTGAQLARKVVAIQKAAGLDPRLMRQSLRSVASRPMARESDRAWQAAYVKAATAAMAPPTPRLQPVAASPAPAPRTPQPQQEREAI
jgi:hypothetical protein